jgi:hypothetical protein
MSDEQRQVRQGLRWQGVKRVQCFNQADGPKEMRPLTGDEKHALPATANVDAPVSQSAETDWRAFGVQDRPQIRLLYPGSPIFGKRLRPRLGGSSRGSPTSRSSEVSAATTKKSTITKSRDAGCTQVVGGLAEADPDGSESAAEDSADEQEQGLVEDDCSDVYAVDRARALRHMVTCWQQRGHCSHVSYVSPPSLPHRHLSMLVHHHVAGQGRAETGGRRRPEGLRNQDDLRRELQHVSDTAGTAEDTNDGTDGNQFDYKE